MPTSFRLALAAGAALFAAAAARAEPHATLSTHIPAIVAGHTAAYVAAPAPDRVMHLAIALPLRNQAQLDAFIADISNPDSPNFRHYISAGEFADRFGPTSEDVAATTAYLRSQGLTITAAEDKNQIIAVDGRVADIERAFRVKIGLYRHPTENRLFTAPDRLPTLDLAVPVEAVIGLDDFVRPHPKLVHATPNANAPRGGTGPGGQFTGKDMRKAYYPTGTLTGAGQSVALFEFLGYNIGDVTSFFAKGYGPANKVKIVGISTDGSPLTCGSACGDDGEQVLDIEYTISLAPGLSSVRVYVGNTAEAILKKMATDNISKIISSSWGWNENFAADEAIFKQYEAQGQTNLTASGDNSSLQASGPWPEESANIIAVGGTDVRTGTTGLWSGETGWSGSAGGPSVDKHILIEPYQKSVLVAGSGASTTLRNVPDIALNANTDMEICANGSCVGGYGGTSFASPMWAGIVAMANQQAVANKKPVVGWLNPLLYKLSAGANRGKLFHDVIAGKSGIYTAGKGYDLVTGIGTPTGQAFINAIAP